mmetsp:Transcript_115950/g.266161  ORF Transcript_115950/g.266161 Transcript_115950/m.266161 type:complete len:155 (+) Transcript_115950:2-466(+)
MRQSRTHRAQLSTAIGVCCPRLPVTKTSVVCRRRRCRRPRQTASRSRLGRLFRGWPVRDCPAEDGREVDPCRHRGRKDSCRPRRVSQRLVQTLVSIHRAVLTWLLRSMESSLEHSLEHNLEHNLERILEHSLERSLKWRSELLLHDVLALRRVV